MSLDDYNATAQVIAEHADLARFGGGHDEKLVERAETALGVRFPPSYRAFVREFGAGYIAGEEFYGITDENLEEGPIPNGIWLTMTERQDSDLPEALVVVYSDGEGNYYAIDTSAQAESDENPVVLWVPGASEPDDELEVVADDFGSLFRELVSEALAERDATS